MSLEGSTEAEFFVNLSDDLQTSVGTEFCCECGRLIPQGEPHYVVSEWAHMLRHACGYALANKGHDLRTIQDYLGHRDPKHTAVYTRTAAKRFENLWGWK